MSNYLIIDGNNMLWRVMRSKQFPALSTSSGEDTKGVFGFLRSLKMLMNEYRPVGCIVVFDGGLSKRRLSLRPDYKARDPKHESDRELFRSQREHITAILIDMGVAVVKFDDREADDVMALIPQTLFAIGADIYRVVVVSEDMDLCQLLKCAHLEPAGIDVSLFRPIASTSVTSDTVEEVLGYPLGCYSLYKAMVGKPREVEGVPRIGEKTAIKILKGFQGGIDLLIQLAEGHGNSRVKNLYEHQDALRLGDALSDLYLEEFSEAELDQLISLVRWSLQSDRVVSPDKARAQIESLEMASIAAEWVDWVWAFVPASCSVTSYTPVDSAPVSVPPAHLSLSATDFAPAPVPVDEGVLPTRVVHVGRKNFDVYIGRGTPQFPESKWANPFKMPEDGTREEVIEKYREYLMTRPDLLADLHELKGKVLGCWCADLMCHGDVLAELADKEE